MTEMTGCLVTVEGNYFALAGSIDRKKVKKTYKIVVRVAAPEGALSVIKNKLLDRVLTRLNPDYHTYHTHEITGITDLEGRPLMGYSNVRIMNFNQIAEYVVAQRLPLKLELYTELDTLRTMVFLAETNTQEFARKQLIIEKEAKEDAVLAALNPELFDLKHPIAVPVVTEVPTIEPAKNISDQKVQQTWDEKQKKFIPITDFKEDFERESEAPYGTNVDDEGLAQTPPATGTGSGGMIQNPSVTASETFGDNLETLQTKKTLMDEL